MIWLTSAVSAALMSPSPSAGVAPIPLLERAVFKDCARVIEGGLRLTDTAALADAVYGPSVRDQDGRWSIRRDSDGRVRIGKTGRRAGCLVRYEASGASSIYEALLRRVVLRGFRFVGGVRKTPEAGAVIDTLTSERGSIAVMTMYRADTSHANLFQISLFPLPKT